jgi:hypothetical protein
MKIWLLATIAMVLFAVPSSAENCTIMSLTHCQESTDVGPVNRDFDSEAAGIIDSEVDKVMVPPTAAEAEQIKKWIPVSCCRSNNCCRKVREDALIPQGNDTYMVTDTGQLKKRHSWGQDGQTWRCACDWDPKKNKWIVHPKANTRCVFPIPLGS